MEDQYTRHCVVCGVTVAHFEPKGDGFLTVVWHDIAAREGATYRCHEHRERD